jgi:hypothetical protein
VYRACVLKRKRHGQVTAMNDNEVIVTIEQEHLDQETTGSEVEEAGAP